MRNAWWLGLALLLVSPALAEPAGRIPAPPTLGKPLPADAQIQFTQNGRDYYFSGAQVQSAAGKALKADQKILLGVVKGMVKEAPPSFSLTPEYVPVLDFAPKPPRPVQPFLDRGGPPNDNDTDLKLFGLSF